MVVAAAVAVAVACFIVGDAPVATDTVDVLLMPLLLLLALLLLRLL